MTKEDKRNLLQLVSDDRPAEVFERLLELLPAGHPARLRTQQLRRRHRQFEEHREMGTLNPQEVARTTRRINGGLQDIIREYDPAADPAREKADNRERDFVLDLPPEEPPPPAPEPDPELGYFGKVDYAGSPTARSVTLTLRKSYGAAYHTCRQAVRHAGMEMESGDRAGGRLVATMAPTGTGSYGEKCLVWVTPLNGSETRVHLVVDSQWPTLTFDFGRHQTKLGQVASFLRQA